MHNPLLLLFLIIEWGLVNVQFSISTKTSTKTCQKKKKDSGKTKCWSKCRSVRSLIHCLWECKIDVLTLENCLLLLYIAEDLYALRHTTLSTFLKNSSTTRPGDMVKDVLRGIFYNSKNWKQQENE